VVHRDLKPGNVMVTREGRVKVLDFGLAKIVGEESGPIDVTVLESTRSVTGPAIGTAPYMAPEQIRVSTVDARADLFAFGIILYELATGKRPFAGETRADIASAILRDQPEPIQSLRGDLPVGLSWIAARCMEKHPDARFQSAAEVARELRGLGSVTEPEASPVPKPQTVASIAVLPFVNRSHDEADEYFSDGLADELLNMLAKIRRMRVAARTSSYRFKGRGATVAEVGRALNVATVLEGSLRKAGNRVRISVQLVNVSNGYQLWSEVYDRTLDDIFAVQDDIAQSVVKELRATLLGDDSGAQAIGEVKADVARAAKGRGKSPEAHRIYLLARHYILRFTRADTIKGIEYLRQALDLEPEFALAWALLGLAYTREVDVGWAPVEEGLMRGRAALERALSLEPGLAEAHAVRGRIQAVYEWDLTAAEKSSLQALESAPGNDEVLRSRGELARHLGHNQEAIDFAHRALEQDPLSAPSYSNLGLVLSSSGRYAEALDAFRKALEFSPERVGPHAAIAMALVHLDRGEEAWAETALEPDEGYRLWAKAIVGCQVGRADESTRALRELTEKYADDSAFQIAEAHAARGEVEETFAWLERAYRQRDGGLIAELNSSPHLRALGNDPRMSALVKRLGFPTERRLS
ncbi:MAG: protein kinase domain-containing protein, partial [Candidatus Eiseniibacteriota bacterium]